jgi:hypothetical protein
MFRLEAFGGLVVVDEAGAKVASQHVGSRADPPNELARIRHGALSEFELSRYCDA